jgi:hypothetical protein
MTELDIVGLGAWSPYFSSWAELVAGLDKGGWQTETKLQPDLIAPRERRRAPQSVKLAVEVMGQACEMASVDPSAVATVFSSSMGDMQITDYLCKTLATTPEAVSPTKFHNSVHNAATGYWSIATESHSPANAVSARAYSASMAFLEAAVQAVEENVPVLLITQEMAAPPLLHHACPSDQPFSAAMLLAPVGYCESRISSVRFAITATSVDRPELPGDLRANLSSNFGTLLLPFLAAVAKVGAGGKEHASTRFEFPLSEHSSISLSL